jgi:hypothetical protein
VPTGVLKLVNGGPACELSLQVKGRAVVLCREEPAKVTPQPGEGAHETRADRRVNRSLYDSKYLAGYRCFFSSIHHLIARIYYNHHLLQPDLPLSLGAQSRSCFVNHFMGAIFMRRYIITSLFRHQTDRESPAYRNSILRPLYSDQRNRFM